MFFIGTIIFSTEFHKPEPKFLRFYYLFLEHNPICADLFRSWAIFIKNKERHEVRKLHQKKEPERRKKEARPIGLVPSRPIGLGSPSLGSRAENFVKFSGRI